METGLHIGGSEVELNIGGIDKEVVKILHGNQKQPYIPGSSLKGKLRSLLARREGFKDILDDQGSVLHLFGRARARRGDRKYSMVPSRLIVRDAYYLPEASETSDDHLPLEEKAENTITRSTGEAKPRFLERVRRGACFELDMVLDVYKGDSATELLQTLDGGFQLLQQDYLGGSGSRGYGKVRVHDLSMRKLIFLPDGSIDDSQPVGYSFQVNQQA